MYGPPKPARDRRPLDRRPPTPAAAPGSRRTCSPSRRTASTARRSSPPRRRRTRRRVAAVEPCLGAIPRPRSSTPSSRTSARRRSRSGCSSTRRASAPWPPGLRRWKARNVVLDPVMVSKSGARLLSPRGAHEPPEATSCRSPTSSRRTFRRPRRSPGIRIRERVRPAPGGRDHRGPRRARRPHQGRARPGPRGPGPALRRPGSSRCSRRRASATRATHGTGCTLSSAIAANLALGRGLEDSVARAIAYLRAGPRAGLLSRAAASEFPTTSPAPLVAQSGASSKTPSALFLRARSAGRHIPFIAM